MGSRLFLLLALGLLLFTDHSQGVSEAHEKDLVVSTFTDASAVGEPLTTANPINIPRQHNRLCNCKGKGREMANRHCVCQQSGRRRGKHEKLKTLCRREKNKNLKKCSWFCKLKKGCKTRKYGPSVPI